MAGQAASWQYSGGKLIFVNELRCCATFRRLLFSMRFLAVRRTLLLILLCAVFLGANPRTFSAEFRAASAKADITPSGSVELWGYSDRAGPATGKRDPLFAKVLLLDVDPHRLALVTLDLGRTLGLESMNVVRDRVRNSAKVEQVFFFASHTHSAPVIDDVSPPGKRPAWETAALDRIAAAIEQAAGRLQPATIGTGEGEVFIGHNRRLLQADGTVKMLWRNATKTPTHPLDPRIGVIRIDGADGRVLAAVVNYACHPVIFGPDNLRYSADYPSATAEVVERAFGPSAVSLFLQGAAGDINPYFDKMRLDEDADKLMQETGRKLGDEALRVARAITPQAPAHPELQFALDVRHFKLRYDAEQLLAPLKSQLKPATFERYRKYLATPLDCPVTTLVINREIALAGMPGEPFVEFGLNFRDRSPLKTSFFAGYANGYFGYFPTIRAAVEGGYGAEGLVARTEVGAGESMLDTALIRIYTMLGPLKPLPR
jgi:neutral ceramidase